LTGQSKTMALGGRRSVAASIAAATDRALEKAWPSYAFITLLQLKIIWEMWRFRDLTIGDTSGYFVNAYRWFEAFKDIFIWSPLYTSFYGTVFMLTDDAYTATILHRVIIVMTATLGMLALMRRLLPPALALLVAMWWAILPINFETLYEIHLFALLPILAAWLAVAYGDTARRRGAALGILLGATILVRNELMVAFAVYGLICAVRELKAMRARQGSSRASWRSYAVSYGLPVVLAIALSAFFYWRSDIKGPVLAAQAEVKHTLNMCQVYAVGYQQRHPEWTLNPWIQCDQLMRDVFGNPLPTLGQMITANPAATWEHFLWNISLVPNGLQVSLFNAMSGTVNPDYPPVNHSQLALVLSLVTLGVLVCGGVVAARNWRYWWHTWFRERAGLWLILLAVAAVAVPVILTQRPRPSYLFATTAILMACIGSAVWVLTIRWRAVVNLTAVIAGLLLLALVPPYYVIHRSDRPVRAGYEALKPFRSTIAAYRNKFVVGDYEYPLGSYLGLRGVPVPTYDYGLLARRRSDQTLDRYLKEQGVNLIFLQPAFLEGLRNDPLAQPLIEKPEALGWQKLGSGSYGGRPWLLLYREP
jgi:hypothetical protein